jgi:pentatricopeptide repeat protein
MQPGPSNTIPVHVAGGCTPLNEVSQHGSPVPSTLALSGKRFAWTQLLRWTAVKAFRTMDKRRAIEASIADYAKRLAEISQGDEQSKRVKKRILQKLGKLKKDLAAVSGNSAPADSTEPHSGSNDIETKDDAPILSKEERKLKLRLLNKDLSEFAQKKQLTLAKKRFEQAIRKGIKVDVHSYTNLINAYVRCSDLRGAEETVQRMKEQQIQPNLVTFTTLLKGYSEMGDMQEASRIYFQCLNAEGGPNVRSLNTFLRACVRTGMTKPALQSYSDFIHRSSSTDATSQSAKKQKTASGGAVSTSVGSGDANGVEYTCDASTYEYLIGLLCRSGNVATAEQVLAQFTTASNNAGSIAAGGVSAIENTAIYITFATAEALLRGDLQASRKWCDLAVDALKRTETATLKDSMLKRFQQSESGAGGAVGEKRAKGGAEDDSRSVALFLKHRRTELEGQLESVQEYLGFTATRSGAGSSGAATVKLHAQHRARLVYLQCLSQVLHFGFDGRCDYDSHQLSGAAVALAQAEVASSSAGASAEDTVRQESQQPHIAARLLLALRDKYGLDRCTLPALDTIVSSANSGDPSMAKLHKALKASLKEAKTGAATKVFAAIDADTGCIDFPALFTPLSTTTNPTASETGGMTAEQLSALPVKLEICSGDGEWVVAQAGDWVAEAGTRGAAVANAGAGVRQPKALWVALELRCDRIQHTLAHYLLSRPTNTPASAPSTAAHNNSAGADHALHNLAFLSGNAAKIIPERVATGSIAEIFINHPQPPDRVTGGGGAHAGSDKNQGSHLLTQDFLAQLLRVLKVNGMVTIVTDNQSYGKSLAASLASLPAQSCFSAATEKGGATKAVLVGGIDRYKLPVDWEHSLDDSHPVQVLAARDSAAEKTGQAAPIVQHARTVDLWRGEAGPEVGHVTTASSYFDRMWDLGQKKRRWFIYVKKVMLE